MSELMNKIKELKELSDLEAGENSPLTTNRVKELYTQGLMNDGDVVTVENARVQVLAGRIDSETPVD
jgi:hypothetical protein